MNRPPNQPPAPSRYRVPHVGNAIPIPRARSRVALALCVALGLGCAELRNLDLDEILELPAASSEGRVASGLKEALRVGTERAVSLLSREGGFSNAPDLRLRLPEDLRPAARALRAVGMGKSVDDLEAAMNRAAETAAGEAIPVFADAVASITISDALAILDGPDDAATRYFEGRTSASLRTRFAPIVESAMQEVGVYRSYAEANRLWEAMPFTKDLAPDLQGYVLDRTLAGLFETLAREEARIREDPAARTTALLRDVFGSR